MKNKNNKNELFREIAVVMAVIFIGFLIVNGILFKNGKISVFNVFVKEKEPVYMWIQELDADDTSFFTVLDTPDYIYMSDSEEQTLVQLLKDVDKSEIQKKEPRGPATPDIRPVWFNVDGKRCMMSVDNDSYVRVNFKKITRYIKNDKLKQFLAKWYDGKVEQ